MTGLLEADLELLRCPVSGQPLRFSGSKRGDVLHNGRLHSETGPAWRIRDGVFELFATANLTPRERAVDKIYDLIAPTHDVAVEKLLPLLEWPTESVSRQTYIDSMNLDALASGASILEIGCGSGANLPLVAAANRDLNYWAVDINQRMLNRCIANHGEHFIAPIKAGFADAHALPFADNVFDRVFHVGGINGYRNPAQGLAEMARVAKPQAPIVVVDEALDRERKNSVLHELVFLSLTFFDEIRCAPVAMLPAGTTLIELKPLSRYYYCMSFQKDVEHTGR